MTNAIDDSAGGEDEVVDRMSFHGFEQDHKCSDVILIVLQWLCDGLSDSFESGKVNDCSNLAPSGGILGLWALLSSLCRIQNIFQHRVSLVRRNFANAHRAANPLSMSLVGLPEFKDLVHGPRASNIDLMEKDRRDIVRLVKTLGLSSSNVVYTTQRLHVAVAQIVDDNNSNTCIEQFKNRVRADVACSSCNKTYRE
jgi:hypothetical protein